ncbi:MULTISPECIES: hypothetical protein [Glutamicibacter]|jgi:hypothetical protein|uniref:DUF485 domain-containing protein n=1 Tax=Glutamicibacter arilaitensis TaxID=256701 RepID=A0A2N7S650_9MICC|nr:MULTISPECIES: hypothetical protein [Glutamicibacter]PMQ21587.1 hypothetical protein CIK84_08670 [Glutamicibacter arilaitensis]HCJ55557.1 hypothetical protein [Glutamicibacter sp.]HCM93738.1 hypothetical protein [Glutamicibacter sp.]
MEQLPQSESLHDPQVPGRFAEQRPQRVRVQAPQDASLTVSPDRPEHTAEEFYVRQLIRSQLRLACAVAAGLLALLVGISALLVFWPVFEDIHLLGLPLPWWVLGVGMYPLIIVAGMLYNKAAERNEERYRSISRG